MTRTVELWMHPDALQAAQRLLITDQSRSVVRRSMAVFDSLVESCRTHAALSEAVQAVSPAPLARTEWLAPMVRNSWPSTPEGGEIAAACQDILLCVYQIGALRSGIAIVAAIGSGTWCGSRLSTCMAARTTSGTIPTLRWRSSYSMAAWDCSPSLSGWRKHER